MCFCPLLLFYKPSKKKSKGTKCTNPGSGSGGFTKKLKEHEARAIIHMHARQHGRATQIQLRGRTINIESVQQYFKCKRIDIKDVLDSSLVTIPDLICHTAVVMSPTSQIAHEALSLEHHSDHARSTQSYEPEIFRKAATGPTDTLIQLIESGSMSVTAMDNDGHSLLRVRC